MFVLYEAGALFMDSEANMGFCTFLRIPTFVI